MDKSLARMLHQKNMISLPTILMVAAESVPFAKTGGLADVVGTLATVLKREGFDVRVMMPYHRVIKDKYGDQVKHLKSFSVDLGWRSQYAGVETLEYQGVPYYFIDNEYYFGWEIYKGGDREGEQYCFFSKAVLEALPLIGFFPDIVHVHDWHTAVIPMLLKTQFTAEPWSDIRTVLTMHSLGYQGKFDFGYVSDLLSIDSKYYKPEYMENYGCANLLKAGIVFADKLTTVSPNYAEEMKTEYYGEGLEGILNYRAADLSGIVNGIDTEEFDPATDTRIPQRYDVNTIADKEKDKTALMRELGLKEDANIPLIGMVTRLTQQKGLDLLMHILEELMREDVALVLLGSGDRGYEDFFRYMQGRYPDKIAAVIQYNNDLAHRIYAGSDFLLMPSRFEPCGISQLIAMRYGTLPIVRATGGLKDTVVPYNRYTGDGWGFIFENYNAHDLLNTIKYAFSVYYEKENFQKLRQSAMNRDLTFKTSALAYAGLYVSMIPAAAR